MRQRIVEVEREPFTQRMAESDRGAVETGRTCIGPNVETALLRSIERPAAGYADAVGERFAANGLEPVRLVERIGIAQAVVHQEIKIVCRSAPREVQVGKAAKVLLREGIARNLRGI